MGLTPSKKLNETCALLPDKLSNRGRQNQNEKTDPILSRTRTALLAMIMITSQGCASDKSTIQKAAAANDQLAPAVIADAQLSDYLQNLGNRIIASAKFYDTQGLGPQVT